MSDIVHTADFPEYASLLKDILGRITTARYAMLKSVNKETVQLYWDIGKSVSLKMSSAGWGKSVVEQLAKDLQQESPGVRGFSARNIWRMKTFYEHYSENEFLPLLVAEVGWTQNCIILEKCRTKEQTEYYLKKTRDMGWSKLDLIDKIKRNHFENQMLAQNNFSSVVPEEIKARVAWEFVDDYSIELINPDQPFSEKELENANNPVGIATYNRYENLPEEYAKYLPSEEKILQQLVNLNVDIDGETGESDV